MEIALHHACFECKMKIEKLRDEQIQLFGTSKELNVARIWNENMKLVNTAIPSIIAMNKCSWL